MAVSPESDPPFFIDPTSTPIPFTAPAPAHLHDDEDIPTIDLRYLDTDDLEAACRDWGLFRLTNHGLPASSSAAIMAESRRLLALPFDDKRAALARPPLSYFWGTPALRQAVRNVNWVEGFHLHLSHQPHDPDEEGLGYSSSLRCLVDEYGRHMARIARRIFDALAPRLKLDTHQLATHLAESNGFLRVYRYPRCPEGDRFVGIDTHTDSSVMSILNQDEVGGLQVLHDGQWFNVTPVSGTLIVNLGDMMQAMSNDEYVSAEHRVIASDTKERMSLCYFVFPMDDAVISSLKYRSFTYKDFRAKVQEDINSTGFKVGLESFRIGD